MCLVTSKPSHACHVPRQVYKISSYTPSEFHALEKTPWLTAGARAQLPSPHECLARLIPLPEPAIAVSHKHLRM